MVLKTWPSLSDVLMGTMFLSLITFTSYAERAVKDKNIIILQALIEELSQGRIKKPLTMAKIIHEECQKHRMDPLLILAVIQIESGFRPHVISKNGAVGLMQIMPNTGREIASNLNWGKYSKQDLFDPFKNVQAGIFYLKKAKIKFKNNKMLYLTAYCIGSTRLIIFQRENPSPLQFLYAKRVLKVYGNLKTRKILLANNVLGDS